MRTIIFITTGAALGFAGWLHRQWLYRSGAFVIAAIVALSVLVDVTRDHVAVQVARAALLFDFVIMVGKRYMWTGKEEDGGTDGLDFTSERQSRRAIVS